MNGNKSKPLKYTKELKKSNKNNKPDTKISDSKQNT